ncbi:MAG: LD-carboxypeptidase [Clostridia bacterium]|nr:LD-carboxypeptidase [Clostridia bacterium]
MKYPQKLKTGDYIATTAPSGGITKQVDLQRLDNVKHNLESLGYNYKETQNVRTETKGRSSSKKERAKQFMEVWKDEKVGAIISAKGGDFLSEMLDEIDWEQLKRIEPKWFQGYSDNTGLTFLLPTITDIACIYGPTIKDYGMRKIHKSLIDSIKIMQENEVTQESFEKCETGEWKDREDPYEEYDLQCKTEWKSLKGENKIYFKGRAIGGCFDVIINIIGTKYDKVKEYIEKYKKDGIVWFLEVFEMSTSQIYLHLWQLKNAGYFENCKGIIFGRPLMVREDYEISYEETIKDALKDLEIPVIFNADIGHVSPQMPIVSGGILEIKYEKGKGKIKNIFK